MRTSWPDGANGLAATLLVLTVGLCPGQVFVPTLLFEMPTIVTGTPDKLIGPAFAVIPDIEGDGLSEVVVTTHSNAPGYPFGVNSPCVGFILGSSGGILRYLAGSGGPCSGGGAWSASGHMSVSSSGDVDQDGIVDVVVGSPSCNMSVAFSAVTGTPIRVFQDGLINVEGRAVAQAGDVNGDGVSDVAVGTPTYPCTLWPACYPLVPGRINVFSGADATILRTYFTHLSNQPGNGFGASVVNVGDVDGDGFPDLAGGHSPLWSIVAEYHAVRSGLSGALVWVSSLRGAIAGCGDVNGDGIGDVVVGGTGSAWGSMLPFQARIVAGGTFQVLHTVFPPATAPPGAFGWACAGSGDADGDGVGDILVGNPASTGYPACCGDSSVHAYSGRTGALLWSVTGPTQNETRSTFGCHLAWAGDLNADGFDDFVVGSLAGGLWIYLSPPVPAPPSFAGNVNAAAGPVVEVLHGSHPGMTGPSFGGTSRSLVVPRAAPTLSLWLTSPPANLGSAGYVLFGRLGSAFADPPFVLPGSIGSSAFPPAILAPGASGLFMIGDTAGWTGLALPPATLQGAPVLTLARPPIALQFTVQAVIQDASSPAGGLSVSNALRFVLP